MYLTRADKPPWFPRLGLIASAVGFVMLVLISAGIDDSRIRRRGPVKFFFDTTDDEEHMPSTVVSDHHDENAPADPAEAQPPAEGGSRLGNASFELITSYDPAAGSGKNDLAKQELLLRGQLGLLTSKRDALEAAGLMGGMAALNDFIPRVKREIETVRNAIDHLVDEEQKPAHDAHDWGLLLLQRKSQQLALVETALAAYAAHKIGGLGSARDAEELRHLKANRLKLQTDM